MYITRINIFKFKFKLAYAASVKGPSCVKLIEKILKFIPNDIKISRK